MKKKMWVVRHKQAGQYWDARHTGYRKSIYNARLYPTRMDAKVTATHEEEIVPVFVTITPCGGKR